MFTLNGFLNFKYRDALLYPYFLVYINPQGNKLLLDTDEKSNYIFNNL